MTVAYIRRRGDSNVIPITFARCPLHDQKVARDGDGRLLGKCWACAGEAADALIDLRRAARRQP